jgi:two-component system response regulator VicR
MERSYTMSLKKSTPDSVPADGPPDVVPLAPGVLLDPARYLVYRTGQAPQPITALEWRVLSTLRARAGHVVPVEGLLDVGWPREDRVREDLYAVVWRLRQLVEEDPHHPEVLVTRRGFGYIWQGPP